ncbi:MAG: hypothetical protein HY298_05750 [Verrucomicrobia bacterium]|nr:hypothetical protein [Verrucomicrobiota bacterium]
MKRIFVRVLSLVAYLYIAGLAFAWDYEGHRMVNELALASLPGDFPAFVKTEVAQERIAFLSGEPDRWRNTTDLPLKHFNGPDHFLDLEELADYKLEPGSLSHFRYEFAAQLAVARALHPTNFPPIDPARNEDHTRELIGFLPWTITEYYAKLKSAFSYLKTFEELGTPEEIINAQQNIIYLMGVMGHFVGDGSQPLHTTKNYNGWVEANPHGFTTSKSFHAWIDGGFIQKAGLDMRRMNAQLRPARMLWPGDPKAKHDDVFPLVMTYLLAQYKLVEPLYQLEKEGKLSGEGEAGQGGREFISRQIVVGGQMLGDLWYSAWEQAMPDGYLKTQLNKRKLANEAKPPSGKEKN